MSQGRSELASSGGIEPPEYVYGRRTAELAQVAIILSRYVS